jgi:hypothetical protein
MKLTQIHDMDTSISRYYPNSYPNFKVKLDNTDIYIIRYVFLVHHIVRFFLVKSKVSESGHSFKSCVNEGYSLDVKNSILALSQ